MSLTKEQIIEEATRAAGVATDILAHALKSITLANGDNLADAEAALAASRSEYAGSRQDWDASKQPAEPTEPEQPA